MFVFMPNCSCELNHWEWSDSYFYLMLVTYSDFYPHRTRWCRWCQWEFGPGTQWSVISRWASPFHPLLCGGPECFPKQTHDNMRDSQTSSSNLRFNIKNKHKSDIEAHLLPNLIWEGVSPRISYPIFLHKGLVFFFYYTRQELTSKHLKLTLLISELYL